MRDMVQCDKCGKWYTFKHGCSCENIVENNKKEGGYMGDLKLKNIINTLETNGVIRINWNDTGESFFPRIGDFQKYGEHYVTGIFAKNNELVIRIQSEI